MDVCVGYFSGYCDQIPNTKQLKEESSWLIVGGNSLPRWQAHEAAGHTASANRKQRDECSCLAICGEVPPTFRVGPPASVNLT